MTYLEKYEELKNEYEIDDTNNIIINKGNDQVVYDIQDDEGNSMLIDFNLIDRTYKIVFNTAENGVWFNPTESF